MILIVKYVLSIFLALIIVWIIFQVDFPLTKDKIVGTYINTNFTNKNCCVEAPHEPDILILYSDNTLKSNFYGRGSYKIIGSHINWKYTYELGKAGYNTYLTNKLFEEPRIILNYDLNHYYRKIK